MAINLSSNAVIYAIISLNSEIELQKQYLESPDLPAEDKEAEEEMLSDLEQAFMEFIDLYKQYRSKEKTLPALEEILYQAL